MSTESLTHNTEQGKVYKIACPLCVRETRHESLFSVEIDGQNDELGLRSRDIFQIVQCQGCENISFREYHWNSEEVSFDEELTEVSTDRTLLFPARLAGRKSLDKAVLLPETVFRIYTETQTALCSQQPILAGIGIRALIESVCQEKAADGYSLQDKIDDLVKKGVVTADGAAILHPLRILGNEAAHQIKPHSDETLALAMDVVENILTNVFILPQVSQRLSKPKVSV